VTNIEGLQYETFEKYIHPAHIEILKLTQMRQVFKIKSLIDDIRSDVLHVGAENLRMINIYGYVLSIKISFLFI